MDGLRVVPAANLREALVAALGPDDRRAPRAVGPGRAEGSGEASGEGEIVRGVTVDA